MKNNESKSLPYRVSPLRAAGLDAKWSKTSTGRPVIVARDPNSSNAHQRDIWWTVDSMMWGAIEKYGIIDGFNSATLLGGVFSISD